MIRAALECNEMVYDHCAGMGADDCAIESSGWGKLHGHTSVRLISERLLILACRALVPGL